MSQPRDDRQDDLFGPSLDKIINLRHPLVRLAAEVDWEFLAKCFGSVCRVGPGQPPLPTRLVAGLLILKHMHDLSDEALCDRWVENPYFQYFCGEVVFRHAATPMPTSSSEPGASSNSCAPGSAASSATFPRWSALAKARPGRPTSSAARSRLSPRSPRPKAGNSCCTPRRCMAIHTTVTRSVLSLPILRPSPGSRCIASAAIRAIAATTIPIRFKVWISGQVRRVTKAIRRKMRRRAAVEPVIGHLKDDHRMRRNYLKGRDGDRINAVLAAAGYNFSLLLRWFEEVLRVLFWNLWRGRPLMRPA